MSTGRMLIVLIILVSLGARAQVSTEDYYGEGFFEQAVQLEGEELRELIQLKSGEELHCDESSCYNFETLEYSDARRAVYLEVDIQVDGSDQSIFVEDVYCHNKVFIGNSNDDLRMPDHNDYNIEHTWPQSRFGGVNPGVQKSDLHHLYPTQNRANSIRGNHIFGEIDFNEGNVCGLSSSGHNDSGDQVFEPPMDHKGNVARSLFYFAVHYGLHISKDEEAVLRLWHELDPVDSNEEFRNEIIYSIQYNRNPFVDYPELVDLVSDF